MDRKQQVLLRLKPKVKAFGFNKKELMSVAAKIADNLTSADDASDEDVNAEIDTTMTKPMTTMTMSHRILPIVRRVQTRKIPKTKERMTMHRNGLRE